MHAGATHLLQRDLLADDLLGHAGRAQVHRRVALHHEHQVAERGDVRPAGGGGAEQAADLGHPTREAHLVEEDAPRTSPAGEELDLVGDAGAGRVDQPHHGQLVAQRVLGQAHDLLDGARPPRAGLDGGVVGHDAHGTAVHQPPPGDHAVRGQVVGGRQRVGQQPVLHEGPRVQQQRQAVAHEQLALAGQLVRLLVQVAPERPLGGRPDRHAWLTPSRSLPRPRGRAARWRPRASCTSAPSR